MHDMPPIELARSNKLREALQRHQPPVVGESTECDRADKSPLPGCGRVASMSLELHRMSLAENDSHKRELYRNAIAALGEIIAAR